MNNRSLQKEETRARILRATVDLFLAEDTSEVKFKDIAARAGVAIPSIAFHFGSRLQLLREVAEVIAVQLADFGPAAPAPGGTAAAMAVFLEARDAPAARALWRVGDEIVWELPEATEGWADAFEGWVRGHLQADGYTDAEAARLATLLAPAALMVGRRLEVGRAPESLAAQFLDSVRQILAERPPRALGRARPAPHRKASRGGRPGRPTGG